ncbi:hypothetical protein BVC80_41g33 [Macleaya cordata]|uniref:Uncharacterized protein n=1 Tax=Macleaya cordata TaxID=56857 RepID=A0A200QMP7_MACCD|nr:hypothetical protein BVC80_41g33 [Macleaya cordata]
MAVEEALALAVYGDDNMKVGTEVVPAKRRRYNRCFTCMEIKIEPAGSLKDLDSDMLKTEIKKWAKAVVAYARQLSGRLGGSNG